MTTRANATGIGQAIGPLLTVEFPTLCSLPLVTRKTCEKTEGSPTKSEGRDIR